MAGFKRGIINCLPRLVPKEDLVNVMRVVCVFSNSTGCTIDKEIVDFVVDRTRKFAGDCTRLSRSLGAK